jgi:iron(II)-dependent oxidoreductase
MGAQSTVRVRHQLLESLQNARSTTDALFTIVRPEALYDRPIPERHRIVFYIGHLEAFDQNLLAPPLGLKSSRPDFDKLFAFGIDPVGGGLPTDQPSDWPPVQEVHHYNRRVREKLDAYLEKALASDTVADGQLLQVAIEHRLMHAETLAYMFHQLPLGCKVDHPPVQAPEAPSVSPRMIEIPSGDATLGLPREQKKFGWDNEFDAHVVSVPAFNIDAYKVTNRQFLEFIRAGGYQERNLWTSEAWDWISSQGVRHPGFWAEHDGSWGYRAMFAELPLPLDWPVYVSHAEASAYARWVGKALPTEAQFNRAAFGTHAHLERPYPWGNHPPAAHDGNFDFHRWDPVAVGTFSAGQSAFGVEDLVGNGWEWTSTVFQPFPGFQPFPFYPRYSANFFDGKHYVMKGGSARTAACLLRRSFRNWFQPHYPYVYAGFRCVEN